MNRWASWLAVGVILTAFSWAGAEEPPVYSENYVAFIQVTVPAHGFAIVSKPLTAFEGQDDSLNSAVGNQLPEGEAFFYSAPTGSYKTDRHYIFGSFQSWGVNDPDATKSGRAFWLKNNADEDKVVVLTGYVPKDLQQSVQVGAPFDLVAPAYPEAVDITQVEGFTDPLPGAILYKYSVATGSYRTVRAVSIPGFGTFWENSLMIDPGEGFWSRADAGFTFTQDKPYLQP